MCISFQMCRTSLRTYWVHPQRRWDQDLGCGCEDAHGGGREGDAHFLPLPDGPQAICSTGLLGNSGCISPNDSVRDSNQLLLPSPPHYLRFLLACHDIFTFGSFRLYDQRRHKGERTQRRRLKRRKGEAVGSGGTASSAFLGAGPCGDHRTLPAGQRCRSSRVTVWEMT